MAPYPPANSKDQTDAETALDPENNVIPGGTGNAHTILDTDNQTGGSTMPPYDLPEVSSLFYWQPMADGGAPSTDVADINSFIGIASEVHDEPRGAAPSQVSGAWWVPDGDAYWQLYGQGISDLFDLSPSYPHQVLMSIWVDAPLTPPNDTRTIFDVGGMLDPSAGIPDGGGMELNRTQISVGGQIRSRTRAPGENSVNDTVKDTLFGLSQAENGIWFPTTGGWGDASGIKADDLWQFGLVWNRNINGSSWVDLYALGNLVQSNFMPTPPWPTINPDIGLYLWGSAVLPGDSGNPMVRLLNAGVDTGYRTGSFLIQRFNFDNRMQVKKIMRDHALDKTVRPLGT